MVYNREYFPTSTSSCWIRTLLYTTLLIRCWSLFHTLYMHMKLEMNVPIYYVCCDDVANKIWFDLIWFDTVTTLFTMRNCIVSVQLKTSLTCFESCTSSYHTQMIINACVPWYACHVGFHRWIWFDCYPRYYPCIFSWNSVNEVHALYGPQFPGVATVICHNPTMIDPMIWPRRHYIMWFVTDLPINHLHNKSPGCWQQSYIVHHEIKRKFA